MLGVRDGLPKNIARVHPPGIALQNTGLRTVHVAVHQQGNPFDRMRRQRTGIRAFKRNIVMGYPYHGVRVLRTGHAHDRRGNGVAMQGRAQRDTLALEKKRGTHRVGMMQQTKRSRCFHRRQRGVIRYIRCQQIVIAGQTQYWMSGFSQRLKQQGHQPSFAVFALVEQVSQNDRHQIQLVGFLDALVQLVHGYVDDRVLVFNSPSRFLARDVRIPDKQQSIRLRVILNDHAISSC